MRALISVSDKTGIVSFAKELVDLGIDIISTGGTYNRLKEEGIEALEVSEITGFPECLDGRVKTLHPSVHAGILAKRDNIDHMKQLEELDVKRIDFVIVNLYPFKETILKEDVSWDTVVENIDIGGPTMLRAAAKNYKDVTVVVDPCDYNIVLEELKTNNEVSLETKFLLMQKVFMHTAHYDTLIANHIKQERQDYSLPETLTITYEKVQDMRYGENPHQKGAFYKEVGNLKGSLINATQLNGKELSFNNINDTNGALELLKEFTEPTVVASKHGNPCGVGSGNDIVEAWDKAFTADKISIYGGIVAINDTLTLELAQKMQAVFLEVLVIPSYEKEGLDLLQKKKNLRILLLKDIKLPQEEHAYDLKKVNGGLIVQTIDSKLFNKEELKVMTERKPTDREMEDLVFAWKVVKYVKSNGIALAKDKQTIGIGPGQVNRVWATKQSIEHGKELIAEDATLGAVLASDAFFPFDDCVEAAHEAGMTAIIQPGGSIRDEDSIKKCDEYGMVMVFTGIRHFRH